MHTGLDSKYNLSHKIHYGRKQQLTRILLFGSPCKQCIDPCGIEQILQHATRHHTDPSSCNKRLEHLAQRNRHLCASLQESPSPSGRYNITKKHQHLGRAGVKGANTHGVSAGHSTKMPRAATPAWVNTPASGTS